MRFVGAPVGDDWLFGRGEILAGGDGVVVARGVAELVCCSAKVSGVEARLFSAWVLDQVTTFCFPPRDTRLSLATNVARATITAREARTIRVRGCLAHFTSSPQH